MVITSQQLVAASLAVAKDQQTEDLNALMSIGLSNLIGDERAELVDTRFNPWATIWADAEWILNSTLISAYAADLTDYGLNAEWSVSVYLVGESLALFDNEDNTYTLYYQPELNMGDDERSFVRDELGTYENDELSALMTALSLGVES